jgi:hypothetical protein
MKVQMSQGLNFDRLIVTDGVRIELRLPPPSFPPGSRHISLSDSSLFIPMQGIAELFSQFRGRELILSIFFDKMLLASSVDMVSEG